MSQQPLDDVPVFLFIVIFALANLAAYEIGFRVGRWWQNRDEGEADGPAGAIVGSILALMAFLLAITMGMASDRYDTRRGLVLDEANSVGTTFLRAGYLPEPASAETQELLREYAPLRIATSDRDVLAGNIARSVEIQSELWTIAEDQAREDPGSDVLSIYIESLNETIDIHAKRIAAGLYARVPPTILWLLVAGVILSLGMVGYIAGLARRRSPITAVVLVITLGAVITLVVDLDRPAEGLIQTSQQPLIDLVEALEAEQ
jgi:hypothetical protein